MEARLELYQREEAYRNYVTDALRMITENTSNINGGRYMTRSYSDIIDPVPVPDEPPMSAEDIALSIAQNLGLKMIRKEGNDNGT